MEKKYSKDEQDYSQSNFDIQYALLDQLKRFGGDKKPETLRWGRFDITTSDCIPIPVRKSTTVIGRFLFAKNDAEQGFDWTVKGSIRLRDRQEVRVLRTWFDRRLPLEVRYPIFSLDGMLWVWNVYKMKYGGGQVVEEKWTGNAGFWIEKISEKDRIYHCSHGAAHPPDFESLVFRITVS